jgi:ParB family chromosome partitioning protein
VTPAPPEPSAGHVTERTVIVTVTDLHPVADNPEADQPDPDQPDAGSSSPDRSPEPPVALLLADPGELVLDANVRTSARLDKPFLASIRDLGVLVPVVAHRAVDGQLRVLLGQRRTLAAVEVGRREIPVYVIDIPDDEKAREIARILGQVAENDDRQDLRGSERAAAFQQLTTLGLTATQVARRTHRKVGEIRAGVAVAGSELAGAAMDRFDLTLVQAAVLAEFDDDSSAVKALTVAAKQHPDQFDHVAQRLRDKRAAAAVRAQLVADLTAAGVRVLDNPPHGDLGIAKLEQLADGDGELTAEAHAGCPGHAAYLRDHGSWDGKVDITPVYVCTGRVTSCGSGHRSTAWNPAGAGRCRTSRRPNGASWSPTTRPGTPPGPCAGHG